VQLGFQPERHRHHEGSQSDRSIRQVGFEQTIKLEERLVVKDNVVELPRSKARFPEAVVCGVLWEVGVVLDAGESFLLCCRDDLAITQQGGGAVVIEGREAQDRGLRAQWT
jgi:hypothetical protein